MTDNITKRLQSFSYSHSLYDNVPGSGLTAASSFSMAAKLGVPLPNLAPDVNEEIVVPQINPLPSVTMTAEDISKEPKKKKYAKEAWPGKKPTHSFLV
jgi:nuclear inhibitor of protein phosphatase 1